MLRDSYKTRGKHFQCGVAHNAQLLTIVLVFYFIPLATAAEPPLKPRVSLQNAVGPLVETYCLDCHAGDDAEAEFSLEQLLTVPQVNHNREAWQKVLKHLRGHTMPPEDAEAPANDQRAAIVAWLEAELNYIDCSGPQTPGHVTIRRLNRTEYGNTIRDLVGVEFDPTETFPRDTIGYGFDNIGDVLSLSPLLVEKYLNAAEKIAAAAVITPESLEEPIHHYPADQLQGGKLGSDLRQLYTNGRIAVTARFLVPGDYLLRARAFASRAGSELARMQFDFGRQKLRTVEVAATAGDPQTYFASFRAEAGTSEIGVSFINDYWNPLAKDPKRRDRNLFIHSLEVVGPIKALSRENLPHSHHLVISATPTAGQWADADAWRESAEQSIRQFLTRAYRRPVGAEEIDHALQLVEQAHTAGDSYQRAMQLVVQLALVSPSFLFRGEVPVDQESAHTFPIDEYQLASRLSYFLWSSMPDEPLMQEAASGTLRQNLDVQLDRMLASPRSDELIRNFGEQWLETRRLEMIEPNAELFPEFDKPLADALREETFRMLRDVFRNNLPLATLLRADYSFLNSRLANHYRIEGVEGNHFRKVQLPANRQVGLLAHGSVLAVTSHPDRTSPVLRGKWILQHLLNDAPPPPPIVADLAEDPQSDAGKSLRERLEIHRASASCNVCHRVMDPLGFSLENFDPLGRWRDSDGQVPIDASGQLPDGREFYGPTGLRDILLADLPSLRKCLVEQLLTYALGRGLEYYDQCAVRQIASTTQEQGDTITSIVKAIVHSVPFQQTQIDSP